MALNALTLSVSNGVQGRHFKSAVSGMTAGNLVEVMPGSAPGFGYSNGFLTNPSLGYDVNLAILRERNETTGENRTTQLLITATGLYAIQQQAAGISASYRSYRAAAVPSGDGSHVWNVFVEGPTGATTSAVIGSATITLNTLTLSGSLQIGTATSGTISGATAGSTITGNIPGITVNSAARTYSGTPTGSAATIANGLVETLAGATNTPNNSSITVAAAAVTLADLTVLPLTATAGSAYSGTITGKTSGSTITAAASDGTTLTVTGTTVSGTFSGAGSPTITLTETLAGATNTPHASPAQTVVVSSGALTFVQSANLVMDFNPETLAPLSDGTAVATFTDSVSGASGITSGGPIAPTSAPTFRNNILNGKPALRMAGSQWYYLGRPTALVNALGADYTIMIVTTNLVAGANALSGMLGNGNSAQPWMVCNLTNLGRNAASQATVPNTLTAGDLYCMFVSVRNSGTFPRTFSGVNFTSFAPLGAGPTAGTADFAIGTGRTDTSGNGNTYSHRGDFMRMAVWNTNLAFVDIVRQVRKFFTYYGKTMPNAGVSKFDLHDGDSITQGVGGKPDACYPYFSAANLSRKLGEWSNNGRSGATMTQLADDFAFQYTGLSAADALNQPVVCSWMEYANMRRPALTPRPTAMRRS
jgi:hypothetical protein